MRSGIFNPIDPVLFVSFEHLSLRLLNVLLMIGLILAFHDDDLPVTRLIMHFSFQEKLFFSKLNGEKKHFSPDIAGIGANGEAAWSPGMVLVGAATNISVLRSTW